MSEFHVNVVKLGPLIPHPNADTLNITKVFDYQVITKKDGFKEGDLVVYLPIDSVVPDTKEWYFLAPRHSDGSERFPVGQVPEKYRVIEAKKLRGIFSQGMLSSLPPGDWKVGDDVCAALNITKYEPPVPMTMNGECEAPPKGWVLPVYTDVEGLRRYPNVLKENEEVVITEKIHGCVSGDTQLETLEVGVISIYDVITRFRDGIITHVLSHNHQVNESGFNLVSNISEIETLPDTEWYDIELEDGRILQVTGDHFVFIPELNAYRQVKDLKGDEKLLVDE